MANQLKMAEVQSILTLHRRGWSFRRIGRELGIHRDTARRYVHLAQAGADVANLSVGAGPGNRPNPPAGSSGPVSRCEPFREIIMEGLERGLSRQRIWQDLKQDHDFDGGYDSVKRFVWRLNAARPLPFRRMECEPGQEAQVDFGTGAPVIGPEGHRRRPHVFRIVLSHSRKGYSEAVFRQTTEDFIRCIENAFHHFGGVAKTLVIDNLRAAVTKADWFDPELNPKIQSFCNHYGTVILPTKPRTPRHKGKIEKGVDYVQDNALKGKTFTCLTDQNRYLLDWDSRVVRVFNHRFEQIAIHVKHEPGRFSTQNKHIPRKKRSGIERGATRLLNQASLIGRHTARWAQQMVQQRGVQGVRVLMGLLNLANRHSRDQIEQACEIALTHGAYRLRTIRERIKRQGQKQQQFEFIEEHPIIRSLSDYSDWVHTAFTKES